MYLSRLHWLALLLCGCGAPALDSEPEALTSASQAVVLVESFRDSFNGANNANNTGLNDNLTARQSGTLAPATYTRVPGLWYSAPAPSIWWAQVNHIWHPDTLSFHESTSALRMDKPFNRDASGAFRLSFVAEPIVSDARDSSNWASVMLGASSASSGFVANADIDFGFLVRSNGGLTVFDNGTQVTVTPSSVPAADRYVVSLSVRDGQVLGTVNGTSFSATLNGPTALPGQAYLYLGAYLEAGQVTRFDDVAVSPVVDHLKHYGYYWAQSSSYGSHLDEVTAHTNLNFAQGPADLAACAARGVKCLLETRWQFFNGATLRPDYAQAWSQLVSAINPYLGSVGGFYVIDEPYWNGVSVQDLTTCVNTIKDTFPNIPVMVVHAVPSISPSLVTPARADWVGFDHYGPLSEVVGYLNTLRSTLAPNQKLWLVPQSFRSGPYSTDAALARANWEYYDLARTDPRILGLLNFGLWTHESSASAIPQTFAAQQTIGKELLRR
ncbi:hypothetical protein JY651_34585 [Pyxidicoccus parkwayensis]|uniref:Uncharacterized protein n=1 Tax=Pyxidicoccus parkwayensis TaxID=2813578 RepID=A0ABX7NNB8_9BACT|nr:hypothetical protein [Pyxidicoccus parkwaysis]QSQ20354.1 hypothetical protein JY651_34585 [Pyxidicoccus parkwaysis]